MLMALFFARPLRTFCIIAFAGFCLCADSDTMRPIRREMLALPRLTLWVWERPEDLRGIDPATTAVAYLDRTILLGGGATVEVRPRVQMAAYPAAAARIAVVRIEVETNASAVPCIKSETGDTRHCADLRRKVLNSLLDSAREPGISALQVDFDATRSERAFYRELLVDLRREMPANLPLSITALASWCSWDNWIHDLPVDEAVPMFFRMEPDRRRGFANRAEYRVRERLCEGSVGISTREPWPENELIGRRIYLFPDRGWRQDFALLAQETQIARLP
jgi:hypothetical protein